MSERLWTSPCRPSPLRSATSTPVYRSGRAEGHLHRHGLHGAGRPEVELAVYNFDRLNAEEGHPSRDWSDKFILTQTAGSCSEPDQPHAGPGHGDMPLPIRIVAPGRSTLGEVDATHSPMFHHRWEGMVIDKGVTMADLKGTHERMVQKLTRGHKDPLPSPPLPLHRAQLRDGVQCHKCGGAGCPTCKGEGGSKLLGAGMVHPRC
jgi:phenylalanyl-tRNA synthetase alpha chain